MNAILHKHIIVNSEFDIKVKEVTIPSLDDISALPVGQIAIGEYYWLKTPGRHYNHVMSIDAHGIINQKGDYTYLANGIRPMLRLQDSIARTGDTFTFLGHEWTMITDKTALCGDTIGKAIYNREFNMPAANCFEDSCVEAALYSWWRSVYNETDSESETNDEN